ncbi:MAG: AarF/ABC1/UbiB kinase family protein [Firmicutes bacterium]|nr:AarF/ABC1/UbiB kinase family protein [Bacillota bacterium]MCL5040620.1 AarF/ABC1/UbiB kinase family protein [Bacillota bacterium]
MLKHGLGHLVGLLGLTQFLTWPERWRGQPSHHQLPLTLGERLSLALTELGPTFIKLGQIMSTRADLLPAEVLAGLEQLQDQVPPFSGEVARQVVEVELGQTLASLFLSFDPNPLAAASIGQVHRAVLLDGQPVVVKVQRPNIAAVIESDLEILRRLAGVAQQHSPWRELYSLPEMVEEFATSIHREINYLREGQNADRFRRNFAEDPTILVPRVYWDYTTPRVLTMEYIEGVKVNDLEELTRQGVDRKRAAENLGRAVLKQILEDGFFHGDPHPGNILVLPGEALAFLDFGIVGQLSEKTREQFTSLLLGVVGKNSQDVLHALLAMGVIPRRVDLMDLRKDIDGLRDRYYNLPFSEIRISQVVQEVLQLAQRHHLKLPGEFTLLAKTLITLEGLVQRLDPTTSIIDVAEPFGRRLLRRRYSLAGLAGLWGSGLYQYGSVLFNLPLELSRLLERTERGETTLKLSHQELPQGLQRLERTINRLTFSLYLLGFGIVLAGMIIARAMSGRLGESFLIKLPLLEVGVVVGWVLGLWLLWSILRSQGV